MHHELQHTTATVDLCRADPTGRRTTSRHRRRVTNVDISPQAVLAQKHWGDRVTGPRSRRPVVTRSCCLAGTCARVLNICADFQPQHVDGAQHTTRLATRGRCQAAPDATASKAVPLRNTRGFQALLAGNIRPRARKEARKMSLGSASSLATLRANFRPKAMQTPQDRRHSLRPNVKDGPTDRAREQSLDH